eukprot:1157528-Pelagomonas_calceolata.AAC.8
MPKYQSVSLLECAWQHHGGTVGKVAAVVANEPFLTGDGNIGKAIKERGVLKVARLVCAALIDKVFCQTTRDFLSASSLGREAFQQRGHLSM